MCTENLIHIDCLTESPKRQRDDRADLLRPDPVRLAPDIIQTVAERIDASQFNPRFPKVFPRFVQHAIWRYCAENGLDVCNGNQINDDKSSTAEYTQDVTGWRCARTPTVRAHAALSRRST